MTNSLVPTNVQLPAHLTERMGNSSIAGAMVSGLGSTTFKRISKRGSRFRIRDGSTESVLPDTTLRCIIVGVGPEEGVTKSFYKGAYDPNAKDEDKKPDCYSLDGVRPAADVKDQQSQSCASCPQNVWGSKISDSGNKNKACSDQKLLAVISADDTSEEPEVYLYTVTPSELKEFGNYGKQLASKGWAPEVCVTNLTFDTTTSYPKVLFKFGGFVEEHMLPVIDTLVGSDLVNEITGKTQATAEPAEKPQPKPHPVKTTASEPEVIIPEVLPAPKKSGFGGTPIKSEPVLQAKVVPSSSLNDDIQAILNGMSDGDDD